MTRPTIVLLPGFNGAVTQPLLVRAAARLEREGFICVRHAPARGAPSEGLAREMAGLAAVLGSVKGPCVLLGRSFGGRVCARLALATPPDAMILLGFPVRPKGKPRPDDERALSLARVPTLVVQGANDELGSPRLIRRLIRGNQNVTLHVISHAAHSLKAAEEKRALEALAGWLVQRYPDD